MDHPIGIQAATAASEKPLWRRVISGGAILLAFIFVALHVSGLPAKLRYPGELNFIEGMPLAEMVHLRQGVPIYAPASSHGYEATNFGPLYYLVGAQLVDPQQPAYLHLRVLTLLGTLGCAAGAALLAFQLSRSYLAAGLAPLLFLSYGFVIRHGASSRSDMVALFLVFAGFMVAHRFRATASLLWAAPLLLAGFYYKQQYVAGPLAVLIFLLLKKRYGLAAKFAAVMTLGGLALLGLFQYVVFSGQAFLDHFVFYNLIPFTQGAFVSGMGFFAIIMLVPLLVSVEFLRSYPDRMMQCYLAGAVALSLLTIGRAGSDTYYFLECALVTSVLFASSLAKRLAETARAVELLVLLAVTLFVGQWFRTPSPSEDDFRTDRAVQTFLRQHLSPGTPALSYYAGDVVRAGLALPFTNLYHYNQLIRKGTVSDRDMIGLLEKRFFGVVVLDFDLVNEGSSYYTDYYMTESIRDAIKANYKLSATLEMPGPEKLRDEAKFYLWVPEPQATPTEEARDAAAPR